jgi:hypothetical protein
LRLQSKPTGDSSPQGRCFSGKNLVFETNQNRERSGNEQGAEFPVTGLRNDRPNNPPSVRTASDCLGVLKVAEIGAETHMFLGTVARSPYPCRTTLFAAARRLTRPYARVLLLCMPQMLQSHITRMLRDRTSGLYAVFAAQVDHGCTAKDAQTLLGRQAS